jgi:hypothetical protein
MRQGAIINHTDCGMLRFTDSDLEEQLRTQTGKAPIAPARFYSFTDAEKNTREQIQKARMPPSWSKGFSSQERWKIDSGSTSDSWAP